MAKTETLTEMVVASPQLLEESQPGRIRFRALVARADFLNRNNRVYTASEMRRAVDAFNARISRSPGAIDHPVGPASIQDIGIKWHSAEFSEETNEVWASGEVVPTRKGQDFAACIEAGVDVGFSTRGSGFLEEGEWEGRPAYFVRGFELATIDGVSDPSVYDARISSYVKEENESMEELNEARSRISELEAQLATSNEAAEARIGQLETALNEANARLAELAATEAANALEAKLNDLTAGHRFGATIKQRAIEAGATLENAEALVGVLTRVVEDFAALGNGGTDDAEGRGDLSTNENEESNVPAGSEAGRQLTEAEQAELRQAGLL